MKYVQQGYLSCFCFLAFSLMLLSLGRYPSGAWFGVLLLVQCVVMLRFVCFGGVTSLVWVAHGVARAVVVSGFPVGMFLC